MEDLNDLRKRVDDLQRQVETATEDKVTARYCPKCGRHTAQFIYPGYPGDYICVIRLWMCLNCGTKWKRGDVEYKEREEGKS